MHLTPTPAQWKGVIRRFDQADPLVKNYLSHYPRLIEEFPWEVPIGYVFSKIEEAHRLTAYCGMVKLHHVEAQLAWKAVQGWRMTRKDFKDAFEAIFSVPFPLDLAGALTDAEAIRDSTLHGLRRSEVDHRRAAVRVVDYAEGLSSLVGRAGGFSPFGDLRGFKGRGQPLELSTSRLVLKGLGFWV